MAAGDYENLNEHRVTSSRTTWMTNSYIRGRSWAAADTSLCGGSAFENRPRQTNDHGVNDFNARK